MSYAGEAFAWFALRYVPLLVWGALLLSILVTFPFCAVRRETSSVRQNVARFGAWGALALFLLVLAADQILKGGVPGPEAYASDFPVLPDALEYAAGARHIALDGYYSILLPDSRLPPRYAPWFSWWFLAPIYFYPGVGGLAASVVLVSKLALAALIVLAAVGFGSGGVAGLVMLPLAVATLPQFRYYAQLTMTEVPGVLVALPLFLGALPGRRRFPVLAAYGVLGGIAVALRPSHLAWLAPLLFAARKERDRIFIWVLLLLPALTVIYVTGLYNVRTFGSWTRNGYAFWGPVPYDSMALTFGTANAAEHLLRFVRETLCGGLAVLLGLWPLLLKSPGLRPFEHRLPIDFLARVRTGWFVSLALLLPFHLLYFHFSPRFFLVHEVVGTIYLVVCVTALLPLERVPRPLVALPMAALAVGVIAWNGKTDRATPRRAALERLRSISDGGAIVVSGLDPVFVAESLLPQRVPGYLPISRKVEYASKLIAPEPVTIPPEIDSPTDHRHPALFARGAKEAVGKVALEALDDLSAALDSGKNVFLEDSLVDEDDRAKLSERFELQAMNEHLFRLLPRRAPLASSFEVE